MSLIVSTPKRHALKRHARTTALAVMLPVMGLLPLSSAVHAAAEVPDTLTWTVPFGVGGGTDVWARFMSNWVTRGLPATRLSSSTTCRGRFHHRRQPVQQACRR
ncbi:hypothetical protein ACU8V3_03115 [Cobetia marina]